MGRKSPQREIWPQFATRILGFDVLLLNVPTIDVDGETDPDVRWLRIQSTVFAALASKPSRLTGNEVRFIRRHMGLTLEAFGAVFGKSHVAARKWELSGDAPSRMDWSVEKDLRLRVQTHASGRARDFLHLYKALESVPPAHPHTFHIDCAADYAIAA